MTAGSSDAARVREAAIPGRPEDLAELGRELERSGRRLIDVGRRLQQLAVGSWSGQAAESFQSVLDEQPRAFRRAGEAFLQASWACARYAGALADAQQQARRAAALRAEADHLSAAWQRRVVEQILSGGSVGDDPGRELRRQAGAMLEEAQQEAMTSAAAAARVLDGLAELAPSEPTLLSRAMHWAQEMRAGSDESFSDLGDMLVTFQPGRLITDRQGWVDDVATLASGVRQAAADPREYAKSLLDWQTWQESPARAIGHLIPDLLIALATGGAGAAAARGTRAGDALEGADLTPAPTAPDVLAAAAQRDIDLEALTPAPVWRESREPLYRADNRPPEIVFEQGFQPKRPEVTDLDQFLRDGSASVYVSTTRERAYAQFWHKKWIYELDAPGGIEVNATPGLGRHPDEAEVAFPGGIHRRHIVGAQPYDLNAKTPGPFRPNPHHGGSVE